jgi:hypothetical protein
MEDVMDNGFRFRWLAGLLMIAVLVVVGVYTYNLGVAHGIAESARLAAAPGGGATVVPVWPRPWGYGFGFFPFFPFFPFLFILFWFFLLRGIFWRGAWHRRRWDDGHGGVPPAFEEWHRRAHAESGPRPATDAKA